MSLFRAFYPILRTQNHSALISAVSPGTEEPIHLVQSPVDQNVTFSPLDVSYGQFLEPDTIFFLFKLVPGDEVN